MMMRDMLAVVVGAALAISAWSDVPARTYEVVLPANPLRVERFAANELVYHLQKATGCGFRVCYEDEVPATGTVRRFYVGATAAARSAGLLARPFAMDEHHVKSVGADLYFIGGDKDGRTIYSYWSATSHGTMWAVYDFLEMEMGVRWLWPGTTGEVIPKRADVPVGPIDRRAEEKLEERWFGVGDHIHKRGMIGWTDQANRERFEFDQGRHYLRHRVGNSRYFEAYHAFTQWWKRYGASHPEFFQERLDGIRGPYGETDWDKVCVTMCVSNPDFHKAIVDNWRTSRSRNPDAEHYAPFVNCTENDSPGMCLCARCRAWDYDDGRFAKSDFWSRRIRTITRREYWEQLACVLWGESDGLPIAHEPPSLSDRYVRYYNAVLALARKTDPAVLVNGGAYANYLAPPKEARVAEGVRITYVPRMFFPYSKENSDLFRKWWKGWREAGAGDMKYRPNYMLAGANLPLNQARVIAGDFAFAYTNGMKSCYYDVQGCIPAWSTHALMNYVVHRLLREPLLGYERALDEFASSFGAAKDDIKAYWAHVETVGSGLSAYEYQKLCAAHRTRSGSPGGGFNSFMLICPGIYSEEFFAKAKTILAVAAKKTSDDPDAFAKVRFLAEGLRESLLTYRARVAQESGDREAFDRAFRTLVDYRRTIEDHGVCNWSVQCKDERNAAGWDYQWVNTDGPNPALVEKVLRGELKEARATWWGYDKENSTKYLQAAIDSKVPRLIISPKPGAWRVDALRGASGQELYFEGDAHIVSRAGSDVTKPLVDLSGLHDVQIVAFAGEVGGDLDVSETPGRIALSIAGANRVRIEGLVLRECTEKALVTTGARNFAFREVTRTEGGKSVEVQVGL